MCRSYWTFTPLKLNITYYSVKPYVVLGFTKQNNRVILPLQSWFRLHYDRKSTIIGTVINVSVQTKWKLTRRNDLEVQNDAKPSRFGKTFNINVVELCLIVRFCIPNRWDGFQLIPKLLIVSTAKCFQTTKYDLNDTLDTESIKILYYRQTAYH
jgi:hypothetical protein